MRIKFWILASVYLNSSLVLARNIEPSEISERQAIDRMTPTLIIFTEAAHLSLGTPILDVQAMNEGDGSKIWKLSPRCTAECVQKDTEIEFVFNSGKHIKVKLRIEEKVSDHVLNIEDVPTFGKLEAIRHRTLPKARKTFLRAVNNWPPLQEVKESVIPTSVSKLAEKWTSYQTDDFTIYKGKPSYAKKRDIELLNDSSFVLAGFHHDEFILISRRNP